MQTYTKMRSRKFPDVIMKVIPGHFVTPNSHINYYIDMTTMKTRQSEAKAAARAMASTYAATTIVDTIVCMDGMEVIGAYLADELTHQFNLLIGKRNINGEVGNHSTTDTGGTLKIFNVESQEF